MPISSSGLARGVCANREALLKQRLFPCNFSRGVVKIFSAKGLPAIPRDLHALSEITISETLDTVRVPQETPTAVLRL